MDIGLGSSRRIPSSLNTCLRQAFRKEGSLVFDFREKPAIAKKLPLTKP
jgi:hypothetical protein